MGLLTLNEDTVRRVMGWWAEAGGLLEQILIARIDLDNPWLTTRGRAMLCRTLGRVFERRVQLVRAVSRDMQRAVEAMVAEMWSRTREEEVRDVMRVLLRHYGERAEAVQAGIQGGEETAQGLRETREGEEEVREGEKEQMPEGRLALLSGELRLKIMQHWWEQVYDCVRIGFLEETLRMIGDTRRYFLMERMRFCRQVGTLVWRRLRPVSAACSWLRAWSQVAEAQSMWARIGDVRVQQGEILRRERQERGLRGVTNIWRAMRGLGYRALRMEEQPMGGLGDAGEGQGEEASTNNMTEVEEGAQERRTEEEATAPHVAEEGVGRRQEGEGGARRKKRVKLRIVEVTEEEEHADGTKAGEMAGEGEEAATEEEPAEGGDGEEERPKSKQDADGDAVE